MKNAPVVLCIGGFDPSGRAGLLADSWAVGQRHARAAGVVTALTAQGTRFRAWPVAPATLAEQVTAALEAHPVAAVKVGMVPNRAALERIFTLVARRVRWVVVDPVVRTSRGQPLSSLRPTDFLRLGKKFGSRTRVVITPNQEELGWLGVSGEELVGLGFFAVVIKGGSSAVDVLVGPGGKAKVLRGTHLPRNTLHHRGTGCRFASGLAAGLGRGEDLLNATRGAKRLVRRFLSTV